MSRGKLGITEKEWAMEIKPTSEQELFGLQAVATMTGKCYRTIHRAAKSGKIKTIRLGASRMVPRREVERILQRGF
jgi:Helix-turn-helix domain